MKAPCIFVPLIAVAVAQVSFAQQSQNGTFSTPAYNGAGAADTSSRGTSRFGATGTGATRTMPNFGTAEGRASAGTFGTNGTTNLGTVIGQPTGRALLPGSPAISAADATNAVTPLAPGTSLTTPNGTNGIGTALTTPNGTNNTSVGLPNSSVGIGQQNTTALGQQGIGSVGRQNTTAPGQQNTTAIGQQGIGTPGRQSTTALGQQGTGTALTPQTNGFVVNVDGTVTGIASPSGGSAEAGLGGTNVGTGFGTNRFRTNQFFNSPTNRSGSAP
jgi:hypothetical protein